MKTLVLALLATLLFTAQAQAITLTWEDTSANEDGFTVEKKDPGATDWAFLSKVGSNVQTYIDKPPVPWGRCYRVKPFNTAGIGAPSNEACVATSIPTKAENLTVTP